MLHDTRLVRITTG